MVGRESRSIIAVLVVDLCSAAAALGQETALGKLVYDLTRSKLDLGLLGLIEFAPAALLVLVTGAVADRWPRPRVAAVGMTGEAIAAAGLAWYAHTHGRHASVLLILAIVLAFGTARAFVAPAVRALPADLVAPGRLPWLMARASFTFQAGIIAGPVLGGFLYTAGVAWPFVATSLILLIGASAVASIEPPPRTTSRPVTVDTPEAAPQGRAGLHEALEGLRFIRTQPVLLGAISLDLFAVLFGGAVALLPAIAQDRLHVGAVGLGWLRAAVGIGAALVTIRLALRPVYRRVGRTLLVVVGLFGVFTIVLGLTHQFAIAFASLAILSGSDAISVFIRSTLVPLVTPEDKRGRVLAVENVFIGASNELGAFESGVAGQLLGTGPAVVLGGAATLAIAGTWAGLFPALRDLQGFPR